MRRLVLLVIAVVGLGCAEGTAPAPVMTPNFSHYQGSDGHKPDTTKTTTSSTECRGHYSVAERTCRDTTGGN